MMGGDIDVSSAHIGGASHYANIDSGGNLTLVGNARVYKYVWIPAGAIGCLGANPASLGVNGNGTIDLINFFQFTSTKMISL
jgi:hypothetical protein